MGWSQGGYISAFLTTHDSARFKAISVGAGISDWMTYYVNTDIHPFTRQYLKATPWDDPEIYAKTSPITYIKEAKAPTLIQHGATDQRVPLPNAYELYQGLQDNGVPSKLIVYKGFEGIGHGPSKPKSSRAVMQHNLEWFDKYIWAASLDPGHRGAAVAHVSAALLARVTVPRRAAARARPPLRGPAPAPRSPANRPAVALPPPLPPRRDRRPPALACDGLVKPLSFLHELQRGRANLLVASREDRS